MDPKCFDEPYPGLQFNGGLIKNIKENGFANIFGKRLTQSRRFSFSLDVVKMQTGVQIGIVDATSNNPHNDITISNSVIFYNNKGNGWNGSKAFKGTKKIKQGSTVQVKVSVESG